MTNYLLNENDRVATTLNPLLSEVAAMSKEDGALVAKGAMLAIGIVSETINDLEDRCVAEALSVGASAFDARRSFDVVFDALQDGAEERIEALRLATEAAGTPVVKEESVEAEESDEDAAVRAIDDVLEGLFGSILGAERAAEIRKSVEGDRLPVAPVEVEDFNDDEDEDEGDFWGFDDYEDDFSDEDEDEETEQETFDRLMQSIFGFSIPVTV